MGRSSAPPGLGGRRLANPAAARPMHRPAMPRAIRQRKEAPASGLAGALDPSRSAQKVRLRVNTTRPSQMRWPPSARTGTGAHSCLSILVPYQPTAAVTPA